MNITENSTHKYEAEETKLTRKRYKVLLRELQIYNGACWTEVLKRMFGNQVFCWFNNTDVTKKSITKSVLKQLGCLRPWHSAAYFLKIRLFVHVFTHRPL